MKNKYLLISLVLLGFALRIFLLSSHPAGFTWDEAALGYNAFSLLKTGRDEYGQIVPLVFKSFGDFKPGLYIYFSVLPVSVFHLSIFSTRLPSAVFGTLSVLIIYILVRRLFPNKTSFALGSAFLLSISPWAVHFSRGAWEANLCLFLTLTAVTLFLYRKYVVSVLFFGLTFFTYQGAKLFTPLLLIGLLYIFRSQLSIRRAIYFLFSVFLFTFPLLVGLSGQSGRLKVFNVFSYTRSASTITTIMSADKITSPNLLYYIFHSEVLDQSRGVVQRFLNHLSPQYLFISGDWSNLRHSIPYQGYFYYPEIVVVLAGLVFLVKNYSSGSKFLFYWLVVAVIPSALSRDIVSGVRSLPLVVPLTVICGIGMSLLFRYRKLFLLWTALLCFFFVYFLDLYFIHLDKINGVDWLTAYPPVVSLISRYSDQYHDIYFSDKLGQPYIFVLFFNRVNPTVYQQTAHLTENSSGDVGSVKAFDKYHFGPIYWPSMRSQHSALFIGDIFELPDQDLHQSNLENYGLITYPNGAPAFRVVGLL